MISTVLLPGVKGTTIVIVRPGVCADATFKVSASAQANVTGHCMTDRKGCIVSSRLQALR
jgi:hypothetical protein